MSEGLKSKVMDVIDSLIPKGQNSLDMRTSDMVYGINKAKEAVLKLFNAESTQNSVVATQDGISRQSVLDAIDEIESEVVDGDGFQYEKWRQFFCDLPSADIGLSDYSDRLWRNAYERGKADAEPRWIPVAERLPENEQDVLVTVNDGCTHVETDYFTGAHFLNYWDEVLAWMPLPECYRGDGNGE